MAGGPGDAAAENEDSLPKAMHEARQLLEAGAQIMKQHEATINNLRIESIALRRCLFKSGALCPTAFDIERHRVRFEWFLERHPSGLTENAMKQALITHISNVMLFSDSKMVVHMDAVSVAFRSVIAHLSRVYAIGGFDTQGKRLFGGAMQPMDMVESLDVLSGDWDPMPAIPLARMRSGSAVANGKLYVVGGLVGREAVARADCLSMLTGIWEPLPPMMAPRGACGAAGLNSAVTGIFVMGGSSDGRQLLNTVECYSELSHCWHHAPPMLERRGAFAAVQLQDVVYVLGGLNAQQKLSAFEGYELGSRSWRQLAPLRFPRAELAAVAHRGRVIAIGGYSDSSTAPLDSVECYEVERGTWEAMPALSQPVAACAAAVSKGRIYVLGGFNGHRTLPGVQLLLPGESFWRGGPPMRAARMSLAAGTSLGGSWALGPPPQPLPQQQQSPTMASGLAPLLAGPHAGGSHARPGISPPWARGMSLR